MEPTLDKIRTAAARFWDKVAVGDPAACWDWHAYQDAKGYGVIIIGRKTQKAHRIAWALWNDKTPPAGLVVMHTCDNRACCNPHHLTLATQAENMADCFTKNRHAKGEKINTAKLTEDQVKEIRRRFDAKENRTKLAREFNISHRHLYDIGNRTRWTHLETAQ